MQLSEKDKQALQEKYRAQRQAMWSGKQSESHSSEEEIVEEDNTTDSTDTTSSDSQSDSASTVAPQSASTESESASEGGAPASSATQDIAHAEQTPQSPVGAEVFTAQTDAAPGSENASEETGTGERVFWETLEQEGGPAALTWKLVLAVIGVAAALIGVGVYLGFLFAS